MSSTTTNFPSPDALQSVPDIRFQALFEQAPISIQILAPDGRTIRVNKAWENLWQIHEGSALKAFVFSADYNVLRDPQLDALMADDQGHPFSPAAFASIEGELQRLYEALAARDLAAGSAAARRLFS